MLFTYEKKVLKNLLSLLFYNFPHTFASRNFASFYTKKQEAILFSFTFSKIFFEKSH